MARTVRIACSRRTSSNFRKAAKRGATCSPGIANVEHSPELPTMKHLQNAKPASALTVADSSAVSAAVTAALSDNTVRAYAAGFAAWQDFAATRGWAPMPCSPDQVAAWAVAMDADGLATPSIRCRLAALAFACRVAPHRLRPDHPPTQLVKHPLRGLVRQRNHRPRQSAQVTPDISGC